MLALLAGAALLAQQQGELQVDKGYYLPNPGGGESRLLLMVKEERLDPPKIAPLQNWMFEWLTTGFALGEAGFSLRLRVYSQQRRQENDVAPLVARMVMRLWDYNYLRLMRDHSQQYNNQIVDFYLCFGGEAGGEHLFDEDLEGDRPRKVNTVYIYQIQSFRDPLEMAREVAHEYGHATLPPVGGFVKPEDWGNGYLGEKLFLRYLRDEIKAGRLNEADAMGASLPALGKWVATHVDPLVLAAGTSGPVDRVLRAKGQKGLDAYLGLALYAELLLPQRAFARSLFLTGSTHPWDYPNGIVLAATEVEDLELRVPPMLAGKPLWVPLAKGKLTGGTVLKRQGDWAQVRPAGSSLRIKNPPP
ncbi:MAG TPA: hypothetical protein VM328_11880 [Fimbriimonadaceae bacterium]|nr:hypothetical protein [Fimbriimonadaceae bacterium]